ncbi:MAG: c-type cytochrome [Rudaea sp.]
MKRLIRWVLRAVAVLVILVVVAMIFVYWRSNHLLAQRIIVDEPALAIPTNAAAIAQGKRLAALRGCTGCHGADLGGDVLIDSFPVGVIAGPNLTRGMGGVGASLTPTLMERAIRHGLGAEGRMLLFMPSTDFSALTDADTADLIAFVQSVPPVDRQVPAVAPGPLLRTLFVFGKVPLVSALQIDQHAAHVAALTPEPSADYGRYLAQACTGCHGEHFSGGPIPGLPPSFPAAQNITPNPVGGLGKWTQADFIAAIRTGKRPDGSTINPFMPWRAFSALTDTELNALWAYLHTLPPRPSGTR